MATFNVYVISYHRSDAIQTEHFLEYCTYVVRKSEEQKYKDAGVRSVWGIEDGLIDSVAKVMNYLVQNAPEDVIAIIDDDVNAVCYRLESIEKIEDGEVVCRELERMGQLMYDLGIGYLACPSDSNVKYYDRPFKFVGVNGGMKMFNRKVVKAQFDTSLKFLTDIDFQMQELLKNRIIMIPNYFCWQCGIDTNKGGNNANKSLHDFNVENEFMGQKWGKYYQPADGSSAGKIRVKR